MFSTPEIAIVNSILLLGSIAALLLARWVSKLNHELHVCNRAARKRAG